VRYARTLVATVAAAMAAVSLAACGGGSDGLGLFVAQEAGNTRRIVVYART
jgi:hypothetical protein